MSWNTTLLYSSKYINLKNRMFNYRFRSPKNSYSMIYYNYINYKTRQN